MKSGGRGAVQRWRALEKRENECLFHWLDIISGYTTYGQGEAVKMHARLMPHGIPVQESDHDHM